MTDGPGDRGDTPDHAVDASDLQRPNVARVHDYILGGNHNFAIDREFAARVQARLPGVAGTFASDRAYLRRVVRFCVAEGVHQFLDLGSGIPTMGNVHEVARAAAAWARVAYVDREPVAVATGEEILAGRPGLSVSRADLRDPAAVLAAPGVREVLDLDRPVAVLMIAVLHFVAPGEDVGGIVAGYRDAVAPGSLMAISHSSADLADPTDRDAVLAARELYRVGTSPLHLRDRDEIAALGAGMTLVEPGVVELREWRPDPAEPPWRGVGGGLAVVGRVPGRPGGPGAVRG